MGRCGCWQVPCPQSEQVMHTAQSGQPHDSRMSKCGERLPKKWFDFERHRPEVFFRAGAPTGRKVDGLEQFCMERRTVEASGFGQTDHPQQRTASWSSVEPMQIHIVCLCCGDDRSNVRFRRALTSEESAVGVARCDARGERIADSRGVEIIPANPQQTGWVVGVGKPARFEGPAVTRQCQTQIFRSGPVGQQNQQATMRLFALKKDVFCDEFQTIVEERDAKGMVVVRRRCPDSSVDECEDILAARIESGHSHSPYRGVRARAAGHAAMSSTGRSRVDCCVMTPPLVKVARAIGDRQTS